LAENIRIAAILLKPYLTHGPNEIFRQMNNTDNNLQTFDSIFKYVNIKIDEQMNKTPQPNYPRLDVKAEVPNIKKLMTPNKKEADERVEESAEGLITIQDFDKVDIKAATIIQAEGIKKADKLLKIRVDLGDEERQIVSGIRSQYE